jgi:hypothetical protein
MGRRKIRSGQAVMEERRAHAEELKRDRAQRSPEEQLALLDSRLGTGMVEGCEGSTSWPTSMMT